MLALKSQDELPFIDFGRSSVYNHSMPRQIDFPFVISRLKKFYQSQNRLPSFSEMQKTLGYRSKGGISALVERLIEENIVTRDRTGRLAATAKLKPHLKLLGTVQAGWPSPAEEELIDTMSLDEFLIRKPESSYLVKVTGDSMTGAGIMAGDLVIVERGRTPKPGDIVIAQVDGEWTMKYFEKRNGRIVLRAANAKYPPIAPKEELTIGGVIVGTVRRYG